MLFVNYDMRDAVGHGLFGKLPASGWKTGRHGNRRSQPYHESRLMYEGIRGQCSFPSRLLPCRLLLLIQTSRARCKFADAYCQS